MGTRKDLAKVAKSTTKDAQKATKKLKKKALKTKKRAAKGYKGLAKAEKLSILKKVVFVAGVLAFVAVRARTKSAE